MEEERRPVHGGRSCRCDYQRAQYLKRKVNELESATAKQLEEAAASRAGSPTRIVGAHTAAKLKFPYYWDEECLVAKAKDE